MAPTVTTTAISAITSTTATSGGNVTSDGGTSVTARGVCWNTSTNPTTANSHTSDGTGTGSYSSSLTSLTAGATYYVRAYATNSAGTSYGSNISFVAECTRPSGLTNIYLYSQMNGVVMNSTTVCTIPGGCYSGCIGQFDQWNTSFGTDLYNGTGTDCNKVSDGYYMMLLGGVYTPVQVSGGIVTEYICPQ